MNENGAKDDFGHEIASLTSPLDLAQQRLPILAGGEVKAVIQPGAQSDLLYEAQENLQQGEAAQGDFAAIQVSILNALPAHIALIDREGVIISVNKRWQAFGELNALHGGGVSDLGQNYLEICDKASGREAEIARQAVDGIRAVLKGVANEFFLEYPCHCLNERRWYRLMVNPMAEGRKGGAVVMHTDITESKLAEEALRESEERFRGAFDQAAVGIAHVSMDGYFLRINDKLCEILASSREDLLGRTFAEMTMPEDQAGAVAARDAMLAAKQASYTTEKRYRRLGGDVVWINLVTTLQRAPNGEPKYFISVFEDITPRKIAEQQRLQAEDALRASESSMAAAQNIAHFGSWEMDLIDPIHVDANPLRWSDEMYRIAGYEPGAAPVSNELFFHLVPENEHEPIRAAVAAAVRDRGRYSIIHRLIRPDGNERTLQETGQIFFDEKTGNPLKIIGTAHDITHRKQADEDLIQSQTLLTIASRLGSVGAWAMALPSLALSWSEEVRKIHEVPPDYIPTVETSIGFYVPECREKIREAVNRCMRDQTPFDLELQMVTAKGRRIWTRAIGEAAQDPDGVVIGVWGAFQDTTDRKEEEVELARINRALMMLSNCNEAVIRAESEQALLDKVCRIAVDNGGYRMAWVGYAQHDESRSIRPVANWGGEQYLSEITVTWNENDRRGLGPAGQTIRGGKPVVCEDLTQNSNFANWLPIARQLGYRALICLPLRDADVTFGLLGLYSADVKPTSIEEVKLLQELADDLAFGILHLRTRIDQQRLQTAVLKVAASVSAATGTEFFVQLARNMAEALGAQAGFVARLLPGEPLCARTLAAFVDGKVGDNFNYAIKDTPCENLLTSDTWAIVRNVAPQLPHVASLAALHPEGYVGRRLDSSDGRPLGQISVVFREPLKDVEFISSTLQIFAARAASELERLQTDAHVRAQASLLDKAQDAIVVRDLNHRILYWNRSAERIYGFAADQVMNHSAREMFYPDPSAYDEAMRIVLDQGDWLGELSMAGKDSRRVTMESRWTLVRGDGGEPHSVLVINTDITERKKLEQQYLRAQRMESIGTLAGGIAHDLNNTLGPIILSLELLQMQFTDPVSQGLLSIISSSAQRGADMVRQVLSFARGVEGRRMVVQIGHIVRDVEKIANDTFLKNITVRSTITEDLWTLIGDPTQLHQVLLNLCVNARDAMPDGGTLTLAARNIQIDEHYVAMNPDAHSGPYVLLEIEDSGAGIPVEVIEKIFDPFFTTKEIGKGTGLGLSTSLAIVKSHGGFFRVYSEPGKGTNFNVYFPAETDGSAERACAIAAEMPRGNGELILVVDDEASIRQITQQTLEAFGYRVALAADGAEAVALYASRGPEIAAVLTDMTMPVMDGSATIRVLRKLNPAVRFIAVSGLAAGGPTGPALSLGVKHFLPKPYTAETLLKTLKQVLAGDS